MLKALYAVTAAAITSAGIVALPSWLSSTVQEQESDHDLKLYSSECQEKAWPYIQASCLLDPRSRSVSAREPGAAPCP
jgi:hypothetical protein